MSLHVVNLRYTAVVEIYKQKRYHFGRPGPVSAIRLRFEQQGLDHRALLESVNGWTQPRLRRDAAHANALSDYPTDVYAFGRRPHSPLQRARRRCPGAASEMDR